MSHGEAESRGCCPVSPSRSSVVLSCSYPPSKEVPGGVSGRLLDTEMKTPDSVSRKGVEKKPGTDDALPTRVSPPRRWPLARRKRFLKPRVEVSRKPSSPLRRPLSTGWPPTSNPEPRLPRAQTDAHYLTRSLPEPSPLLCSGKWGHGLVIRAVCSRPGLSVLTPSVSSADLPLGTQPRTGQVWTAFRGCPRPVSATSCCPHFTCTCY